MKSKKNPTPAPPDSASGDFPHEQITELAHTLWLEEGKPEGRELQHWLEAERQLRAGGGAPPPAPSKNKSGELNRRDVESDKRVDGLGPANRDPRTPKGEGL